MSRSTSTRPSTSAPPPAAPRRERLTLLSMTGPDAPRRIAAAQAALEASYLKARKRKLPADVALFIGSTGPREKTVISLTAHYPDTPEQRADVSFLRSEAEVLASKAA